jgi:hypothetical protein
MDAHQGASLVDLIEPPLTLPIHYDDYTVFRSPLGDFQTAVERRRLSHLVRPIFRGETMDLAGAHERAPR